VRRFLLILMIALLPVRGWLGDAMAMQLVQAPASAAHLHQHASDVAVADRAIAHHGDHAAHADHADHANHADHAAHEAGLCKAGDADKACEPSLHVQCGTCQMCHSVAASLPEALALPSAVPQGTPGFHASAFVSAEPAPAFKPPIS
jgi:hypothetical protein